MRVISKRALNFTVGRKLDANGNVTDPGRLYTIPPGTHVVPDEVKEDPSWDFCVTHGELQEITTVAPRAVARTQVTADPAFPGTVNLPGFPDPIPIAPVTAPSAGKDAALKAAVPAAPAGTAQSAPAAEADEAIKPVVQPKANQPFAAAPAPLAGEAPAPAAAETQKD